MEVSDFVGVNKVKLNLGRFEGQVKVAWRALGAKVEVHGRIVAFLKIIKERLRPHIRSEHNGKNDHSLALTTNKKFRINC